MDENNLTVETNAKEKKRGGNALLKIISSIVALLIFIMALAIIAEDTISAILLILSAVLLSPIGSAIITKLAGNKKTGILNAVRIIAAIAIFVFSVMIASDSKSAEQNSGVPVKEAYEMLVAAATEGNYSDGCKIYDSNSELITYKDAESYNSYCKAIRAYNAGGIGYAYKLFLTVPDTLSAQEYIDSIQKELSFLTGVFKADNNKGSYLYFISEQGAALTKIIGYSDALGDYSEALSSTVTTIIKSKFTDGTDFYAIGLYSELNATVTVDYVIYNYEKDNEVMILSYEGNEYTTFNGVYKRIK